jgi:hypothetical protein
MMLTGNNTTSNHNHAKEETGILAIGRTPMLAEGFRDLVTSSAGSHITVDATCYSNSFDRIKHPALFSAVFIVNVIPNAIFEIIYIILCIPAHQMASIIFAAITGSGSYNKMKYYLAGADYCMKFNSTPDESAEVFSGIFSGPEWQKKDNLLLDPTRMCLIGDDKRLDVSFAEMNILEAFSQTRNHILSHDEIARIMGLNINFYDPRALEKSISRLRGKIKDMFGTNAIQSIRGYGYRLIRGLISTT